MVKQKTEIEIEFSETIAYSKPRDRSRAICPQCQSPTEMTAPHIAATLTGTTEREIYRFVETGKVHFIETAGILICLNSLINFKKTENSNDPLFVKSLRQWIFDGASRF